MITEEQVAELKMFCRGVREIQEGTETFLLLDSLQLPPGRQPQVVDALLCVHQREGYTTRLYLSAQITDRGANWKAVYLVDRQWHTWSWQGVSADQRPAQILAGHLKALQ